MKLNVGFRTRSNNILVLVLVLIVALISRTRMCISIITSISTSSFNENTAFPQVVLKHLV